MLTKIPQLLYFLTHFLLYLLTLLNHAPVLLPRTPRTPVAFPLLQLGVVVHFRPLDLHFEEIQLIAGMVGIIDEGQAGRVSPFAVGAGFELPGAEGGSDDGDDEVGLSFGALRDGLEAAVIFVGIIHFFVDDLEEAFVEVEESADLIFVVGVDFFLPFDFLEQGFN